MSKVYPVDPENPNPEILNLAVTVLLDGGILVFPTETVYGLGTLANKCFGRDEIFEVKLRPADQPIPLLVETEDALDTWGEDVAEYAHRLAHEFWPGPLTLVVKAAERIPAEFRAPDGSIGLRCPDLPLINELLHGTGGPLFCTSANTHGEPAPTSFDQVEERIIAHADLALDGGQTTHQQPSTVVNCMGAAPVVLREGAISAERIAEVAGA